ncbi:MAG: hypothetical protein JWM95_5584 [Gemmatimonadetes bacterium]|nr:hypothetical protein [Gemmatimonadota bacterium]
MTAFRIASLALILAAAGATLSAQAATTPPKTKPAMMDMEHEEKSGWNELDKFHAELAAGWHPAAMSGDLKPARARAATMSEAAQTWFASSIPIPCDTREIRDARTMVASESKAFEQLVAKQAPDAELKAALKTLHGHFEVVEKKCKLTAKMP